MRAELAALNADPFHMSKEIAGNYSATSRRSALQSQLAIADAEAATEIREAFSDAQRVENAMNGVVDRLGIETTVGQPDNPQIPARDFRAAAISGRR